MDSTILTVQRKKAQRGDILLLCFTAQQDRGPNLSRFIIIIMLFP